MKKQNYKAGTYANRNTIAGLILGLSIMLTLAVSVVHANEDPSGRRWHQESVGSFKSDRSNIAEALFPLCYSHKIDHRFDANVASFRYKNFESESSEKAAYWVSANWNDLALNSVQQSDEDANNDFDLNAISDNLNNMVSSGIQQSDADANDDFEWNSNATNWNTMITTFANQSDEDVADDFELSVVSAKLIPGSELVQLADDEMNDDFQVKENLHLNIASFSNTAVADAQMTELFVAGN